MSGHTTLGESFIAKYKKQQPKTLSKVIHAQHTTTNLTKNTKRLCTHRLFPIRIAKAEDVVSKHCHHQQHDDDNDDDDHYHHEDEHN